MKFVKKKKIPQNSYIQEQWEKKSPKSLTISLDLSLPDSRIRTMEKSNGSPFSSSHAFFLTPKSPSRSFSNSTRVFFTHFPGKKVWIFYRDSFSFSSSHWVFALSNLAPVMGPFSLFSVFISLTVYISLFGFWEKKMKKKYEGGLSLFNNVNIEVGRLTLLGWGSRRGAL